MGVKEILIELKDKILSLNSPVNDQFDESILLEDHPIGNDNIYRLCYVNYRMNKNYFRRKNNMSMLNWQYDPFVFPSNMTREEGFKVLSYFMGFLEEKEGLYSLNLVRMLDSILDNDNFGFIRIDEQDENKIINLFIVGGDLTLFKNSHLYSKYFNWYVEDVLFEEVKKIYEKYGINFCGIELEDNKNERRLTRMIKK